MSHRFFGLDGQERRALVVELVEGEDRPALPLRAGWRRRSSTPDTDAVLDADPRPELRRQPVAACAIPRRKTPGCQPSPGTRLSEWWRISRRTTTGPPCTIRCCRQRVTRVSMTVRVGPDAELAASRLQQVTTALDPSLQIGRLRSLGEVYRQWTSLAHTLSFMLGSITVIVLLFAMAGMTRSRRSSSRNGGAKSACAVGWAHRPVGW